MQTNEKDRFILSPSLCGNHEIRIFLHITRLISDDGTDVNDTDSLAAVGKIIDTALKMGWKVRSRPVPFNEETLCDFIE
jgi:hypothetical protein